METKKTMTSPSKPSPKPHTVVHELVLVQSQTLKDFFDMEKGKRIMMIPYWIRLPDGTLWFEFINERTDGKELLNDIKAGIIYIRKEGSTMKVTQTF